MDLLQRPGFPPLLDSLFMVLGTTPAILAMVHVHDDPYAFWAQQELENAIGLGKDGKLYATVDIDKALVGRTRMVPPVQSPNWDVSCL